MPATEVPLGAPPPQIWHQPALLWARKGLARLASSPFGIKSMGYFFYD